MKSFVIYIANGETKPENWASRLKWKNRHFQKTLCQLTVFKFQRGNSPDLYLLAWFKIQ